MIKFLENFPIYYINLKNREDRDIIFKNHMDEMGIKKYTRIIAREPKDVPENALQIGIKRLCSEKEVATSYSHLYAIKYFLENSKSKYAVFLEDDSDLSNLKKVNFTISDLFEYSGNTLCFQLAISTRKELSTNFKIHPISDWNFNCSAYVLSREYAEKLIQLYFDNDTFILSNFKSVPILEYRNNSVVDSKPVAEYVVYDRENTLSCPIISFFISESSIQNIDEHLEQNIKSRDYFIKYWSKFEKIDYADILDSNKNLFLPSKLQNIKINKKIALVIPWRETPSRVKLFNTLLSWYQKEFPQFDIITSDSGHKIFNAAASRNMGIAKAFSNGNDIVVCSDSDVFASKDSLIKSIINAVITNNITIPYTELRKLTIEGTEKFLKNDPNSFYMLEKYVKIPKLVNGDSKILWPCGGIIIITKEMFKDFGGMDESYSGWGVEDVDYHKRYLDTFGKLFDYIDGSLISLYHSRKEWLNPDNRNIDRFKSKHNGNYIF